MPSATVENYIKAIYQLRGNDAAVTTNALAEALSVSAASTTNMVKKLAALGLVEHSPYRGIALTPAGEKRALETIRHHRLIELFLAETLEVPWDQVHMDAERMEHVISEELEDRIAARLGNPTADPHGDPIPTKEGHLPQTPYLPLAQLQPGQAGIVRRVCDQDPAHLRYLASLGLVPQARLHVLDRAPFSGPLMLRVAGRECSLSLEFANALYVSLLQPAGELLAAPDPLRQKELV